MTTPPSAITIHDLLRHQGWLNGLARHLVGEDPEDVVQDVWAQAVQSPPAALRNPRGWLATVVMNRGRSRARSLGRRQRRDLASGTLAEAPATPEEAASRLELLHRLAALIEQLPDPYRHVIYLRYVEDREPKEIAELLGVPAGTIRWRLKEALTKLRAGLDDHHGGKRAAWLAVLAPLAAPRRGEVAPTRLPSLALVAVLAPVLGVVAFTVWRANQPAGGGAGGPPGSGPGTGPATPNAFATGGAGRARGRVRPLRPCAPTLTSSSATWTCGGRRQRCSMKVRPTRRWKPRSLRSWPSSSRGSILGASIR